MRLPSTLTLDEFKLVKADLEAQGLKLPKVGCTIQLSNGARLCRDVHGFYLSGPFPGVTTPWAKGNVYV